MAILASVVLAALSEQPLSGRLDPRASDRAGSRALARVLEREGVAVTLVRSAGEAADLLGGTPSTLLIANDALLTDDSWPLLRGAAARTVLVEPRVETLSALAPSVRRSGPDRGPTDQPRPPLCQQPDAAAAGPADVAGQGYAVRPAPAGRTQEPGSTDITDITDSTDSASSTDAADAAACYPTQGDASLIVVDGPTGDAVVLGDATPLTNEALDEDGNAALALRLLGAHDRVVWLLPDGRDLPEAGERSLVELLPAGVRWGIIQAALAAVILALVQARRLGRVVPEPLPVVVRSAETTEGLARLYRRGRARDRSAEQLRAASRRRLLLRLGLAPTATPPEVVAAISARTGVPADRVVGLLYGPAPTTDRDLVALPDDLDRLERKVSPS